LQFADQKYDRVKSVMAVLSDVYGGKLLNEVKVQTQELRDDLRTKNITGRMKYEAYADLRYVRQAAEMTIRIPEDAKAQSLCQHLREAFHLEQERNFGFSRAAEEVMLVNIRVKAILAMRAGSARDLLRKSFDASSEQERTTSGKIRAAYFGAAAGEQSAQVLNRAHLLDNPVAGPVIIEEFDTTIVVPPGWTATLDEFANVVMEKGDRK
jgi:N-methylhydantoinase A